MVMSSISFYLLILKFQILLLTPSMIESFTDLFIFEF